MPYCVIHNAEIEVYAKVPETIDVLGALDGLSFMTPDDRFSITIDTTTTLRDCTITELEDS